MRVDVRALQATSATHRIRREQIVFHAGTSYSYNSIAPQVPSYCFKTITDTQTTSKKYSDPKGKKQQPESTTSKIEHQSIQSRLVLLTLAFPRLRIIWSSSPHATALIFADLKSNNFEPDPAKAVTIGTDDGDVVEGGENTAAEDVLRGLPGVGTKNYRYVMGKVGSVRELCELDLAGVQELLGVEPGKKCFEFLHHGLKNR
jgi:DNA excision repair protein ERCC-4